jgi:hypothetical protein
MTYAYLFENKPLYLENIFSVTEAVLQDILTPETSLRRQKGNERTAL